MLVYLKDAAAKLQAGPPAERLTPPILRWRAAFQEAVVIEQEMRKGDDANPTIVVRADCLVGRGTAVALTSQVMAALRSCPTDLTRR